MTFKVGHPERSEASKRFLQLATGVPKKPAVGSEQDPEAGVPSKRRFCGYWGGTDLLLLQIGRSRFLRRYARAEESARS